MDLTLVQKIAIWSIPLLFAITLHEVAHGWVAHLFGDRTAKQLGRLSINPVKHIDPFGTILIPALLLLTGSGFIFGYAKPIPVNARNILHPRYQMPLIALAGPFANLLMALFWAGIAKIAYLFVNSNPWLGIPLIYMGEVGITINVLLGVLNCLPIPPLDGWKALYYLLPGRIAWYMLRLEHLGPFFWFFIILILLFTGVLSFLISPVRYEVTRGITYLFGL